MTQDENIFEETSAAEPTPFLSLDLERSNFNFPSTIKECFISVQNEIRHALIKLNRLNDIDIEKRLQYIESALLKGGIIPGKIEPTPKRVVTDYSGGVAAFKQMADEYMKPDSALRGAEYEVGTESPVETITMPVSTFAAIIERLVVDD